MVLSDGSDGIRNILDDLQTEELSGDKNRISAQQILRLNKCLPMKPRRGMGQGQPERI